METFNNCGSEFDTEQNTKKIKVKVKGEVVISCFVTCPNCGNESQYEEEN